MKNPLFTLVLILTVLWGGCHRPVQSDIQVHFRTNNETLFIIYTIAGHGVMPVPGSLSYVAGEHFAPFKNHPAVKMVGHLIQNRGVDFPVQLMNYFSDVPHMEQQLTISHPEEFFEGIVEPEDIDLWLEDFTQAFTDFYLRAGVAEFLQEHDKYYQEARKEIGRHLPARGLTQDMESYYGVRHAGYVLHPSPMLYPTWGFGSRLETHEGILVLNTFGPQHKGKRLWDDILWDFDSKQKVHNLTVHEFGHSFVNPVTLQSRYQEMIASTDYLLEPIAEEMARQGYRTWWVCFTEHLVRLGEIRIAEAMGEHDIARQLRDFHIDSKHFVYIPQLEKKILEYEANREQYPTFEHFFPELLKVLQQIRPVG